MTNSELPRTEAFPSELTERIETQLAQLSYSLKKPHALSQAVLRLSDFYLQNPSKFSPLNEPWAQAGYLAYFFPLNYIRNLSAVKQGLRRHFFSDLEAMVDFGSGLGSASLSLQSLVPLQEILCIDRSQEALDLQKFLSGATPNKSMSSESLNSHKSAKIHYAPQVPDGLPNPKSRLACFSYVLTEDFELPEWALESEAIVILEPSTQDDGRRLMGRRQKLIEYGFHLWAPCLHQEACPLLVHSEKDWCHDRVHFARPDWWLEIEKHLPMKNRTLTYSYLLARKTPPIALPRHARLVGDQLDEKGKSRILMCRSSSREVLSWMPQRMKEEIQLYRGDLIEVLVEPEPKGNELRVKASTEIIQKP